MTTTSTKSKTRILIFIGSLRAGGKERRLIELLSYLTAKGDYDFLLVMTKDIVHYPQFYKLNIPVEIIKKVDLTIFYTFYNICKNYNPHLIHTWGRMQTFYTLPTVIAQKLPLINSQITSAPPKVNKWSVSRLVDHLNFRFSKAVLSNSRAGLESFKPPKSKRKVIYNGINMSRFDDLPDVDLIKAKYGITTPYTIIMSASFSPNKNYDLFCRVANHVIEFRKDITFIGVGESHNDEKFKEMLQLNQHNPRIKFPGRIDDVEALVNACDIGLLFSVNGEGISNSIMEYMALSKPVIASAAGGTKEIVHHNINGYLIEHQSFDEISNLIIDLIDNRTKCKSFGEASRRIIDEYFSLESMGKAFERTYEESLISN